MTYRLQPFGRSVVGHSELRPIFNYSNSLWHRIDNGLPLNEETEGSGQSNDGLYEAIVRVKIPKINLKSPTAINCVLTIPGTNYTKKRETIFYGKFHSFHIP